MGGIGTRIGRRMRVLRCPVDGGTVGIAGMTRLVFPARSSTGAVGSFRACRTYRMLADLARLVAGHAKVLITVVAT